MIETEILKIQNLSKNFSKFIAVDNLSIDVKQNSCMGFLGPNGAGKTTTLKILTGLLKPTSGKAFINGNDIRKNFREAMSMTGAVIETPEFYPNFTPIDVLSYFGKLRGLPQKRLEERIREVLEEVNMKEWSQKKIGKFSKGMKQRIAIASALLHEPQLVILDEPASGLDPRGMIEIRELIRSMKNQGKTIFMSSHLLGETESICDQVALIDKGKLLGIKSINDLQRSTKSKIRIEFLDTISESRSEEILNFKHVKDVSYEKPQTVIVLFEGDNSRRAEFLKFLQEKNFKIVSFAMVESNLELLYKEMVSDSVR